MTTILIVAFFVSLGLAIFAFTSAVMVPANGIRQRLWVMLGRSTARAAKPAAHERAEQAMEPLSKMLPHSPQDTTRTRAWLMQAGLREPRYVTIYYGVRVLLGLAALFATAAANGFAYDKWPLPFLAGALGYFVPRFFLKHRIKSRQRAIQLALPDALDLATICVEAGLSLDHALQRVGQELEHVHPQLSDEFRLITLEVQAGKTRAEALRNFTARVNTEDVRALVAVLLQTDRFGTSIATALRVHSDALRVERRQRAEEAAAKTTIKMVPVLVFFIFPAMLFVILGPAFIELIRTVLTEVNQ